MKKTSTAPASSLRKRSLLFASLLTCVFLGAPFAYGAGFQIPNQSLKAIGSAGANIAYNTGPDAAYYNPANMSFQSDNWAIETSLTTLWLPEVNYQDNRTPAFDGSSDFEMFFLPQIHLVSKEYNDFRFGFALTYPYGLAKSWDQPFPQVAARHFSLDVVEASPSFSYRVNDDLSLAVGVRAIYAKGEVRNTAVNPPIGDIAPLTTLDRDLDADDIAFGYNLAMTFRPTPAWRLAATYRSKVDLNLEGDADLTALVGQFPVAGYNGSAALDLTLPAVFSLATSYSFGDLTLEVAWNRTFWSDIDELDFNYGQSLAGSPFQVFDEPVVKDWKDSDALRFGLTYQLSEQFTTTLGFAIDNTPIPERTVNFDLPDSDAYMYGLGVQYAANDSLKLGVSYMYYHTTSRSVTSSSTGVDGTFDDGGAHAITVGAITSF